MLRAPIPGSCCRRRARTRSVGLSVRLALVTLSVLAWAVPSLAQGQGQARQGRVRRQQCRGPRGGQRDHRLPEGQQHGQALAARQLPDPGDGRPSDRPDHPGQPGPIRFGSEHHLQPRPHPAVRRQFGLGHRRRLQRPVRWAADARPGVALPLGRGQSRERGAVGGYPDGREQGLRPGPAGVQRRPQEAEPRDLPRQPARGG